MNWYKAEVEADGYEKFTIVHNIECEWAIGSIDAAVDNWAARTDTWSDSSLCDYINGKGMHIAYTLDEYKKLIANA